MNARIALILSVVLGLVAVFAARAWIDQEQSRMNASERREAIVVAAKNLRAGQSLTMADMTMGEVPRAYILKGMRPWGEVRSLEGRVLIQDLEIGMPIMNILVQQNPDRTGTPSNLVPPGRSAITLPVSAEESHYYMIRPNDMVNIVVYMEIDPEETPVAVMRPGRQPEPVQPQKDPRGNIEKIMVTALLAEGVPVLAVDNQGIDGSGGGRQNTYRTLTLALEHENTLALFDAQNRGGRLRFPLRSRNDHTRLPKAPEGVLRIYSWYNISVTDPTRGSKDLF